MFDKLIESDSVQAEFKPRRKFFMMSSVVVGIVFLSAVMVSLYAQDINLGTDEFELAQILAPIDTEAPKPEPPQEQPQPRNNQNQITELPNRPDLIERIDRNITPPDTISTTPNTVREIPESGRFTNLQGQDTDGSGPSGPVGNGPGGTSSEVVQDTRPAELAKSEEPPPPLPPVEKKTRTISKGVVNGTATSLPIPPYPPSAKAMGIFGSVQVQVLIDERGDVVSAHAIDGHVLLKGEAEKAARRAKFKPTTLSDEPVKVTGIIVYKFAR